MGEFSTENAAPSGAWKIYASSNYKYVAPDGAEVGHFLRAKKTISHKPLDKPLKNPVHLFAKMFLLFFKRRLKEVLSILKIGKRRQFFEIPPGRFGSSRPSLREGIVLE